MSESIEYCSVPKGSGRSRFSALIVTAFLFSSVELFGQTGDNDNNPRLNNAEAADAITSGAVLNKKKPPKLKPPTISLSVAPTTIDEGQTATFTIRATTVNPSQPINVNYSMTGSAILGTDYVLDGTVGQFTILPGASSATVTVTALTDSLSEPNETAIMTLGAGTGYKLAKTNKKAAKPTVTIVNVAVTSPLQITSVSDFAPIPLVPLRVTTTGLAPTTPVSVSFSNGAGFFVTDQAIRVQTDGTVIVAVPLYIDPNSTQITSGSVSMTLTQGTRSSSPVTINIQDLPALSTYGIPLGKISHSFLIMDTILEGRRLNQLQAAQAIFNNVDTSTAQSTEHSLLVGAVRAQADVDRVLTDNSAIISGGTLSNGTAIQFDRNSQEMMDRVVAVYLTELAGIVGQSNGSVLSRPASAATGQALTAITLKDLLTLMEESKMVGDIAKATQDAQNSDTRSDFGLAIAKGANGFVGLANMEIEQNATVTKVSDYIGGVLGVLDVVKDVGTMAGDLGAIIAASASGNDPGILQVATNDLNKTSIKTYFDSAGLGLAAAEMYFKGIEGAKAAIQGLEFGLTAAQFYRDSTEAKDSFQMAVLVANHVTVFPSPNQGFAQIEGTDQGSNAPQNSVGLCCFGAKSLGIIGVDDPSGNYGLFVPLGVAGTAYNNLTLSVGDVTTGNTLGSETVDLTGLNTSQPVQVPPFSITPPSTTTYDGSYSGNFSGEAVCTVAGVTVSQPVPLSPITFALKNGAVVGAGLIGGVDTFGHVNMTIPVPGVGAVTFDGTIAFTGSVNGTWGLSGLPAGCSEGGSWSAARQ